MIVFSCQVCRTSLSAQEPQAGQLVRCPTCLTALRVPVQEPVSAVAAAGASEPEVNDEIDLAPPPVAPAPQRPGHSISNFGTPIRTGGKRYGFNCGYCSSRLEATEAMAAQDGQCPTCGNSITIPILDRYGRLIDPKTRQIIKQDPHPVHAYAAAGERAPVIFRDTAGTQFIKCPRCASTSTINANNCKICGMPFTMEGTTLEAAGSGNGFCTASMVLGIIALPAGCTVIPAVLAIIFGIIGYNQATKSGVEGGGKRMAIAGIICGSIGGVIAILWFAR